MGFRQKRSEAHRFAQKVYVILTSISCASFFFTRTPFELIQKSGRKLRQPRHAYFPTIGNRAIGGAAAKPKGATTRGRNDAVAVAYFSLRGDGLGAMHCSVDTDRFGEEFHSFSCNFSRFGRSAWNSFACRRCSSFQSSSCSFTLRPA